MFIYLAKRRDDCEYCETCAFVMIAENIEQVIEATKLEKEESNRMKTADYWIENGWDWEITKIGTADENVPSGIICLDFVEP